LQTQDIRVIVTTPPLLECLAAREPLVDLIRRKVQVTSGSGPTWTLTRGGCSARKSSPV
jgi:hypothetical protein